MTYILPQSTLQFASYDPKRAGLLQPKMPYRSPKQERDTHKPSAIAAEETTAEGENSHRGNDFSTQI